MSAANALELPLEWLQKYVREARARAIERRKHEKYSGAEIGEIIVDELEQLQQYRQFEEYISSRLPKIAPDDLVVTDCSYSIPMPEPPAGLYNAQAWGKEFDAWRQLGRGISVDNSTPEFRQQCEEMRGLTLEKLQSVMYLMEQLTYMDAQAQEHLKRIAGDIPPMFGGAPRENPNE